MLNLTCIVKWLTLSRFGYDIAFGDRQAILEVFYNNIKDKSKLHTGKNLSLVRHHSSGVTVICDDGTSYTGDVLAGADGVNSKTRSEMWRLADEQDPELVKKDKECWFICFRYEGNADLTLSSSGLSVPMPLRYCIAIYWFEDRRHGDWL